MTHLACGVFGLLGEASPGGTWTAVNVTLALATAVVVAVTARALGGRGAWGAALFLVLPATVWAALSPLAEASLAFGVAVLAGAVVAATRTGRARWWVLAGAAAALLTWTRSNYALLLLAVLAWVVWSWRRRRLGWRGAALTVLVALGIVAGHAAVAAAYPNAGVAATLMVGAAGASSNMDFFAVPVPFDAGAFAAKAARGAWRALTPRTGAEAAMVAPIVLAIVAGCAAGGRETGRRELRGLAVLLLVTYVLTCAIFQPQTRYLYAAAPVAAMLLDLALTRWWSGRRLLRGALAALVAVGVAAGVARGATTARALDAAGTTAAAATARLEAALPAGGAVIVVTHGNATDIGVAYAAIPRPTLSVDPRLMSPDDARALATSWGVTALVGTPADDAYVRSVLGPADATTASRRGGFTVWRIEG